MKKIESIKVKQEQDDNPDLYYLGEFHRGDRKKFDMETYDGFWFTPGPHWPHNPENWKHVSQEEKEKVIKQYGSLKKADWTYAREDRQRLIDYYKEKWWMIGIVLEAKVGISEDGKNWEILYADSSLWGIESDLGKEHFNEIIEDLKYDVIFTLKKIGFTKNEINSALASAELKLEE